MKTKRFTAAPMHTALARGFVIALGFAATLVLTSHPAQAEGLLRDLGPASDFEVELNGGGSVKLSEMWKDGPVLVDFWATWCGPCRKAMPGYQKLYDEYKDRGFSVLALSQDSARHQKKVAAFVEGHEFSFTVGLDPDRDVGTAYRIVSLPTAVLVAPNGRIVSFDIGYAPGHEEKLARKIEAILAEYPVKKGSAKTPQDEARTEL